jgi:hypothetical protein
LAGEAVEELPVQPGEIKVVGAGGNLGEAGENRLSPTGRVCAEPRQAVPNEAAKKLGKPTIALNGKLDARSPRAGPETTMAGNAMPRR